MSSIIIGAGTTVDFYGRCVISANWGYQPNIQNLYCIGSFTPQFTYDKPVQTLSIQVYSSGGAPVVDVTAAQSCVNGPTVIAAVSPAACGDPITSIPDTGADSNPSGNDWFVTSYGFSKDDPQMPGQETWGLQRWLGGQITTTPAPDYVINGIASGQATKLSTNADPGVVFTGTTAESETGQVSAGGMGRNDILTVGTVIQIGGSDAANNDGKIGQGSVSIPLTPLWL